MLSKSDIEQEIRKEFIGCKVNVVEDAPDVYSIKVYDMTYCSQRDDFVLVCAAVGYNQRNSQENNNLKPLAKQKSLIAGNLRDIKLTYA